MSDEDLIQRMERIADGLEKRIMERVEGIADGLEKRTMERVEGRIDASEDRMKSHVTRECEKVETRLLREFHWWARPVEIRVRDTGSTVHGFEERLVLLEEHMRDIERRLGNSPS
jgi:hypothetical protein